MVASRQKGCGKWLHFVHGNDDILLMSEICPSYEWYACGLLIHWSAADSYSSVSISLCMQ